MRGWVGEAMQEQHQCTGQWPGVNTVYLSINDAHDKAGIAEGFKQRSDKIHSLWGRYKQLGSDPETRADRSEIKTVLEDEIIAKRDAIASDANYRFIQWVAGHCGEDNVKALYNASIFDDPHAPIELRPPYEHEELADLRETGRLQFKPSLVAARDEAFAKIQIVVAAQLGSAASTSKKWSMDALIRDNAGFAELFARLTADRWLRIQHLNPRRYYTAADRRVLHQTERAVLLEVRKRLRSLNRDGDGGIYAQPRHAPRFSPY